MHRGDLNHNVKEGKVRALLRENRRIAALPPPPPEPRRPMHPMEDVRFVPRSAARNNRTFPAMEEEGSGESMTNVRRALREPKEYKSATEKTVEKVLKDAATDPIRSQDGDEKVMIEWSDWKKKMSSPSSVAPNASLGKVLEKAMCVADASKARPRPNVGEEKVKLEYKETTDDKPVKKVMKVASPELEIQVSRDKEQQPDISWFVPNSPPIPTLGKRFVHPNETAMENIHQHQQRVMPHIQIPSLDEGVIIRVPIQDENISPDEKKKIQAVICTWRKDIGKKQAVETDQENAKEEIPNQLHIPNGFGVLGEDSSHERYEWSLFQVWNNLAYVTCSVPSRIAWSDQERKFELRQSRIQQFCFGLQITANVVDMISWWRKFKTILSGASNPIKYVRFAALVVKMLVKLCHFKTVFGMSHILRTHERAMEFQTTSNSGFRVKMRKGLTIACLCGYYTYLLGYSGMSLAFYTTTDLQAWDWGLADLIQSFACYARQKYAWMEPDECPDTYKFLSDVALKEFALGGLGIFTYISGIIVQEQTTLMIMTSSLTLLSMSWNSKRAKNMKIEECQDVQQNSSHSYYNFLEESAMLISSFIGLLLSATLADVGCDIPYCLDQTFNNQSSDVIPQATRIFLLFTAFILACISAMQIDELQDSVVEPNSESVLPRDIRRLIVYLHRVFRKTVGLGYRSLYVMKFPFLLMYCSVVASLVCFTYEQDKDKKD